MSYTFGMRRPKCSKCGMEPELDYEKGMTYNVGPMFHDALGGHPIRSLHNVPGWLLVSPLRMAALKMRANPDKYRAMNPPNGWGSYESALETLEELLRWCEAEPDALLEVR